ncbi:uncharacterized protein PHACADRAFT_264347 [Phanerochaete carnosa HHB-10118-sp]|uniref:Glucose-methanol-choline oxidoreductase N-terminal domain-containing protein n=1 Tax=Phanerochaete carnosa (strain HHB-10118-sp) TaxID=650164 RepID=K5VW79_PHACS|nr:uncharacterized protein PHACADRAFT_264347 [Phanerochaete carnosa HHB-10118-sp]EKM50834.1 hypothetical protein PHACADRAFT_264347 [Phanerochaete carnosa HHB-10118-sp]
MRSLGLLLAVVLLSSSASCFTGGHRDIFHDEYGREIQRDQALRRRNIVYNGQIANSYDFVVVGGGTAGLAIASRLSEDSNHTVLVLEAGDTGDAVANSIDIPGNAYYSSLLGSSYDWNYQTVVQPNAANRQITWPRGKVLGGSSALNGMYAVRPSKLEVDAWGAMIPGGDKWNWNSLFANMKKSENFTAPSQEIQQEGNIMYDPSSHGTSGPVHVSYPGYILPVVGNWTVTLEDIGIPFSADANGGDGWGGFIATSTINPTNWTRSYSRSAYIDPLPPRANLDILANSTVTRIIFATGSPQNNLSANSVEFATSRTALRQTVNVTKEVIIASGAIGSPQVLMLSGVGPSDVLQAVNIPVNVELPGIGQHLQDHISTQVTFQTSDDTAASLHAANATNLPNGQSSPFLSFINSATAYANISDLLGSYYTTFQENITSALQTSSSTLVPSTDTGVIAGYEAIYNTTVQLMGTPIGQMEILLSLTGTTQSTDKVVAIQAALQHPFSQGRLYINSSDPFDPPVIDPKYISHPADIVMLREGLKLARILGNTAPLSSAVISEVSPGPSVQSDDDWDAWAAENFGTEFHPSCSCAMLPQEQGGVVDSDLKVYGLANVRVADASVFPIAFAAHLQMPTYGLAEQAANIIRAQWNGVALTQPSSVTPPTATSTQSKPTETNAKTSNASSFPTLSISFMFSVLISIFLGL